MNELLSLGSAEECPCCHGSGRKMCEHEASIESERHIVKELKSIVSQLKNELKTQRELNAMLLTADTGEQP